MNWFDTSGLTSLAKSALKEAQKTIDKALDIQDESDEEHEEASTSESPKKSSADTSSTPQNDSDFFSSWGLTVSAESPKDDQSKNQSVVTESPSKSTSQSVWGSFAGSFFEQPKSDGDGTIVRPPKAKSMNVIADSKYSSQDDLFSKSQLVMSDAGDSLDFAKEKLKDEVSKSDERRESSKSNRLSLVSSLNSSDSVEVLSQSVKTTPDSEAASLPSASNSSSIGLKQNSESVEILPDSLISPSSIECLGFDSYASDRNSTPSSILSPDLSDKKSTPIGDKTERPETADSVSLVADDEEDTISYNSISECTAPTVLDTDDTGAPFTKLKLEGQKKSNELIHLEQPLMQKMQLSENSSNDGSWSDRTLNADNDSVTLEPASEEAKKEEEDIIVDKLSDSSSFYNVHVSSGMVHSSSSAFINVEKQQCSQTDSTESSQKDSSVKERVSPISSDSKSDLVKIGSDRTSGHTSGDELETATSSDIEIIPSPNGDGQGCSRNSPGKYAFKSTKIDGATSPHLVDLVLGKSLASKIFGHKRELSEASVQSNTSDESQGSENERLMRRLCEMAEILEARENKLMEVSRINAELEESNVDLKNQVENLVAKHEGGDIHTLTEDYTQRMSALEKKFQQAIRDKDQLRKQLDSVKNESSRKNSTELETSLREKDEVISQLQEEGEKLAKQQLQHSNIIKKLRAKEKDNEQVVKGLRDKVAELTSELDRLKRSVAAKEELEVNQIEAVYRLTTANKKLETELNETRSLLDDTTQRLESTRSSLDACRQELTTLQRSNTELTRKSEARATAEQERNELEDKVEMLTEQLQRYRAEKVQEEKRWLAREESLRRQLTEAREMAASSDMSEQSGDGVAALLAQLAALQSAALEREQSHAATSAALRKQLVEAETALAKAAEREKLSREELQLSQEKASCAESLLQETQERLQATTSQCQTLSDSVAVLQEKLASKSRELEELKSNHAQKLTELQNKVAELEAALASEKIALDTEKKRNAILQEQVTCRGDISPPHSLASDSLSNSLWTQDEGCITPTAITSHASAMGVEEIVAQLQQRAGEMRTLTELVNKLRNERDALRDHLATAQANINDYTSLQEQYDALLQMYGEKEEQVCELKLDLQDVTLLYKQHLQQLPARPV